MKHLKSLFLILPLLVCSGCNNEPSTTSTSPEPVPPAPAKTEFEINYTLAASLRKEESTKTGGYDLTFSFKDSYFDVSATTFSKDIAMVSYGNTLMTEKESEMLRFYQTCEFDDIESHYVATQTADTVSYMFAHRKIGDANLIAVSIKGFNYGQEWAGNFTMGSSGNHQNFEEKATEIYNSLKTYLAKYQNNKLWISGYSRAGGITNMMSHIILSRNEIGVPKENMFVYTFEAPKGVDVANKIAYENVFNIVNSVDLIPIIAPEQQYGLCRCGIDVDIYQDNFAELIAAFDEDIVVPSFMEDEYAGYTKDAEYQTYVLNQFTKDGDPDDDYLYVPTRADFASKIQGPIRTAFDVFYGLSNGEKLKIMSDLKAMIDDNPLSVLSILMVEGGLYNFLTPYLDEDHYAYDPTSFMADTEAIRKLAVTQLIFILGYLSDTSEFGNNLKRVISMHYPEVNYVLLRSFERA